MSAPFSFPVTVRYFEADQQGVVFNMWFLAYCDEAFTAMLEDRGLPYERLLAADCDVQLVHSEIDWSQPVRWRDDVEVLVAASRYGRSSFVVDFDVRARGTSACRVRTTYVAVRVSGGAQPVPALLADALGPATPLWPLAAP